MKISAFVLVLLMLAPGLAPAALPPLLADSAALDRAFIPALMQSNGKDPAKAREAHERYEAAWTAFAAAHRDARRGDPAWAGAFAAIDVANGRARAALAAGRFPAAHQAQEEVRLALWKLRAGLRLDYLPDRLTAFHETMEEIVLGAARLDPSALGPADVARLRERFAIARQEWQAVRDARWEPADYGFDEARRDGFRAAVAAESRALDDLGTALDTGNGQAIVKAAGAIKPPFVRAYRAFGAFAP